MKKLTYLFFISIVFLIGCNKDDGTDPEPNQEDVYGNVSFSFNTVEIEGRISKTDNPAPTSIVVSILDEENKVIFENKTYPLTNIDGNYSTENIELSTGNYTINGFNVLNSDNEVILSAPISGSDLAAFVSTPLPIDLTITENRTSNVIPEVLWVDVNDTSESFGYTAFGFDIIETQNLYLILLDSFGIDDLYVDGTINITIEDINYTTTTNLNTGTNVIRIPFVDNSSNIVLKVNSTDFNEKEVTINSDDVKNTASLSPMVIIFEAFDGFATIAPMEKAVNTSLWHLINEELWGRKLSVSLMLRSDMVDLMSSQTRRVEMNSHTVSTDNEMVYDPWNRSYMGIASANNAIIGGTNSDLAEDIKNPIIAQAQFLRAWYYFHLVRLHGDIPYITNPYTNPYDTSIIYTPANQVYENIIADLEFAKLWLPETVESRAIPSKAAASSYLALVHLTMGNYQEAWTEAKEVIDNSGVYNLALDPDFQTLFNADKIDSSLEPIFALDYDNLEGDDNSYDQIAPMTGIRGDDDDQGWSVAVPTLAVYNSFNPDDYRTRVSFQTEATINGTTVDYTNFTISGHAHAANQPYIAKYTRYPGAYARGNKRATSHNYSMLRYAELLLIAAEAAVELGDNASALSYVNMVRERARQGGQSTNGGYVSEYIPPSAVPEDLTSITLEDVLEERRIELAFECKRWYDIKRRQLGNEVFSTSGYEGIKPYFDSSDYLTPIPQR